MEKKIGSFLVIFFCCVVCCAQQVVSTGGYAVRSEISVDWILGGSLSDIPISKPIWLQNSQSAESGISIKVYPIPAADFINIEITPADTGRLTLELYNSSGVKILNKIVVSQPVMQVNIRDVPSGIYLLKVLLPGNLQLFGVKKIIKY